MKKYFNSIILASAALSVLAIASCKKYDNPPPVFEELKPISNVQRKVLVISIDGATGSEIKAIAPTNIAELQKTAKYSYDVLKSKVATDAASWVSMVTGVSYSKHQISNDNFERVQDPSGDGHAPITSYRNVLDYITQYKATKTAVVTPWANLRTYLRNADFSPVVSTDLAVKDSTVSILSKQEGVGVMVVNFRDVEAAGANGGFLASNPNYKNAVVKADEYVGNIVTAVKARKNYAKEDWLIVVTTNHGGSSADPKNGFFIASNKNLKQEEVKKSGFNSVLFSKLTSRATPGTDANMFDGGLTNSFTVQMDVKFNAIPGGYSSFTSKSTNLGGQVITGWQWSYYPGGKWVVTVGGSANGGGGKNETSSTSLPGTAWHTLTMTINTVGTVRTMAMYIDGNPEATKDISSAKNLSTSEIFRVGHRAGDNDVATSFNAANLQYFNIALDAATVKANFGLKDITKHTKYTNLIGYWPMDEGAESVFASKLPGVSDFSLSGDFSWTSLGTNVPPSVNVDPSASSKSIILTPSAVGANMMYWMNVKILPDFGMDGNPFLNQFELEFLK